MNTQEDIIHKIGVYKKRFFLNQFFKRSLIGVAILLGVYLFVNLVEYQLRLGTTGRTVIFFSAITAILFLVVKYIGIPLKQYFTASKNLSNEDAAQLIGNHFPEIKDKLLNIIQLKNVSGANAELVQASIVQKTNEIGYIPFGTAINFKENTRLLKYPLIFLTLLLGLLFIVPDLIKGSTTRIIQYQDTFIPEAPFTFQLLENNLTAYKNEEITISLSLQGNSVPAKANILVGENTLPMKKNIDGTYDHVFENVTEDFSIQFEAAGYTSQVYDVQVLNRPLLQKFNIKIDFPRYLGRSSESIQGAGNLDVPEGSNITWSFDVDHCDSIVMTFNAEDEAHTIKGNERNQFSYGRIARNSTPYEVSLKNAHSSNKEEILYELNVIKDQYPSIQIDRYQDTILFDKILLGGLIQDDYGLRKLDLHYRTKGQNSKFKRIGIPIVKTLSKQNFGYEWLLDSTIFNPSDKIEYFLMVWDNDGVNGSKSSKTGTFQLEIPSEKELEKKIEDAQNSTENAIGETIKQAQDIRKDIQDIKEDLKGQKKTDWKDKKNIEELLEKRQELEKQLEQMKLQQEQLKEQNKRFGTENEEIIEKSKQLQDLMEELLDEETKKLYDELKKLLEESSKSEEFQQVMDKLENKEKNLEREMDRALEMFKQMKFDMKLDNVIEKLSELGEKQEELSEETKDKGNDLEDIAEEQKEINEEFNEVKEEMKALDSLNQDLSNPNELQDFESQKESIDESLQESEENLSDKKRKKSSESQKKSGQQMKGLQQQMQSMAASMESEGMEEDMENLRQILDNLVTMSFDQEQIMTEFSKVQQSDPRFVSLSQEQLKLQKDSEIVIDSLFELAKRVEEISVFVTREANTVENNIDESIKSIRARKQSEATARQQLCLTSINNLALMLDNVLSNMQSQMAQSQSGSCKKGKKKSSPSSNPGLSKLQQQLNKQISDLKKSGKSGRKLSEELGKLAAQQEQIRQKLKEMEQYMEGDDGKKGGGKAGNLNDIKKQMEETELDLVRKQITNETIMRQKQIMTKLLEAENSLREKELDQKREGKTPDKVERSIPPSFAEYLKKKEREIELLKTVPLKLNSFYKKEVNQYFDRLEN